MNLLGKHQAAAVLCALLLVGCGGGGGGAEGGAASSGSGGSSVSSSSAASQSSASSSRPSSSSASSAATGLIALNASTSCNLANFRAEVLAAVNQARATPRTCGTASMPAVAALSWEDRLFSAAARHSQDMAANNYFSHTSLDGRSPGDRISAEGYAWRAYGENIAASYATVAAVMQGWINSPGHCSNIMSENFTEIGVSCVTSSSAQYGTYWTMALGSR